MATYFDTLLECKSNSQLFQDPRGIIQKTYGTCKDGICYFQSCGFLINKDITELSKKYPDEVFEARIWTADEHGSAIRTIIYTNGEAELKKIEPNYSYIHSCELSKIIGEDTMKDFWNIAIRHIKHHDNLDHEMKEETLEKRKDNITYLVVHVENEKYKIEVRKKYYSLCEVKGFVKSQKNTWELIEEKRSTHEIKKEQSNIEEYDDLPF